MTPTANVPEKVKIAKNLFDLSKFERRTVEKEIELKSVSTIEEALTVSENDEKKVVATFNKGYRRAQIAVAKAEIMSDDLVSPKVVSGFVNQFRPMFPEDTKLPEGDRRKDQNQKIYAFIRSQDALLNAIKAIAAATAGVDEEDDSDGGNDSGE